MALITKAYYTYTRVISCELFAEVSFQLFLLKTTSHLTLINLSFLCRGEFMVFIYLLQFWIFLFSLMYIIALLLSSLLVMSRKYPESDWQIVCLDIVTFNNAGLKFVAPRSPFLFCTGRYSFYLLCGDFNPSEFHLLLVVLCFSSFLLFFLINLSQRKGSMAQWQINGGAQLYT